MTIDQLPFDSNLFNYPVGKLIIDKNWNEEDFLKATKGFQLVYIFSDKPLLISDSRIRWVDTKIFFEKKLLDLSECKEIQIFKGELTKNLEELAYLSGELSRFKTDSRLQNGEFQKLYKIWINKAIESKKVLVEPQLKGMVTVSLENGLARIGLIAVAKENQSQGLGKKLVQAAEFWAYQQGATSMQIPTQEKNIPACKLYQSLGYEIAEKSFIYHFYQS